MAAVKKLWVLQLKPTIRQYATERRARSPQKDGRAEEEAVKGWGE